VAFSSGAGLAGRQGHHDGNVVGGRRLAHTAVLVVATGQFPIHRDHRDEALLELPVQLGIAGSGALVATSVVGYPLARSALRPVEHCRGQAAQIDPGGAGDPGVAGVRLELPSSPTTKSPGSGGPSTRCSPRRSEANATSSATRATSSASR
jgi:hypothetical protein